MNAMVTTAPSLVPPGGRPGPGAGFLTGVAELVHRHRAQLLAFARRRGLDAEDALDAVQDSFISFLRLPEAQAIASASTDSLKLLTVILRHNVLNQRRKHARRRAVHAVTDVDARPAATQSSEVLVSQAEELARVAGCLRHMARLERDVVMLSLLDEEPRASVAKVLGISDGYARVLLHRAREHVRTCPDELTT